MLPRPSRREVALVTDGFVRKSVAAVRALGRRGIRVVACATTALAPALTSRYAWRRVVHPPLALDPRGCLAALEEACRRFRPSAILAMEEETLLALLDERERFEALGARLPYSDASLVRRLSDKLLVEGRARAIGIDTPRTWADPRRAAREASFPVVVKPRRGSGAFGVRYVASPDALLALDLSPDRDGEPVWIVQERLCGRGIGVSLLYDETQRLRARFTHVRLREYPSSGGASTLRESARAPEVESASQRLLEAEGFIGPAMVEWKVDHRDGRAKLLEVNPRFWGSLGLAIRAGADFPGLLYEIARGDATRTSFDHAVGVRARWFLPGDFMHFAERRDWRGLARSLWPGLEPSAPDDVIARDDAGASIGALLFTFPFMFREEFRRFRRLTRSGEGSR